MKNGLLEIVLTEIFLKLEHYAQRIHMANYYYNRYDKKKHMNKP